MSQRISRWALLSTISAITAMGSFAHAQLTRPRGFSMTAHEFLALPPEGRAEFILALRQWSAKVEKIQSVVSFKESGSSDAAQVAAGISFEMFAAAEAAAGGSSPQGTCVVAGMVSRRVPGGCSAQAAIKQMNENFGFLYENGKAPAPSECGAGQMPCSPLQGVLNNQGKYICTKYSQTFGRQALSDQCLQVQSGGDKSGKLAASFLANSIEDELTAASGECSLMDVINNINVADEKVPEALSAAFDKIVAEKPNCKVAKLEARFNDFNKVCTDAAARTLDVPCTELRKRGAAIREKYKSDLIAQLGRKKNAQAKAEASTCTVPVTVGGDKFNYEVTSSYKTGSTGQIVDGNQGFQIKKVSKENPALAGDVSIKAAPKGEPFDAIVEYTPNGSPKREIRIYYSFIEKKMVCDPILMPAEQTPNLNCGKIAAKSGVADYCTYDDTVRSCPENSQNPFGAVEKSLRDYQLVGDLDPCNSSRKFKMDAYKEGGKEKLGTIDFDGAKKAHVVFPGNEDAKVECAVDAMFNNRYNDRGRPKGRPLTVESVALLKARLKSYQDAVKGGSDGEKLNLLLQNESLTPAAFAKAFCQPNMVAGPVDQSRKPASDDSQQSRKQSIWKKFFPFGKRSKASSKSTPVQQAQEGPGVQLVELDIKGESTWACADLSEKDLKSKDPVDVSISGPFVRIYTPEKGAGGGCANRNGEALDLQLDPKSAGIRPNLVAWNFKRYYADSREPYFEVGVKDNAGGNEKWDCNASKKDRANQKAANNKKSSLYIRTRQCDEKADDDFSEEDHLNKFTVRSWSDPTTGEKTLYVCRAEAGKGKEAGTDVGQLYAKLNPVFESSSEGKGAKVRGQVIKDTFTLETLNASSLRVPFPGNYKLEENNSRCLWERNGKQLESLQSLKNSSPRSGRPAIR